MKKTEYIFLLFIALLLTTGSKPYFEKDGTPDIDLPFEGLSIKEKIEKMNQWLDSITSGSILGFYGGKTCGTEPHVHWLVLVGKNDHPSKKYGNVKTMTTYGIHGHGESTGFHASSKEDEGIEYFYYDLRHLWVWTLKIKGDTNYVQKETNENKVTEDSGMIVINADNCSIYSAAINPNGQELVGACGNTLKFWDMSGKKKDAVSGLMDIINVVAYSPDGRYIAVGGVDFGYQTLTGVIKVWDSKMENQILHVRDHTKWIYSLSFSPDGKYIAGCGNKCETIKIWEIADGKEKVIFIDENTEDINTVAFSPDGRYIASGNSNRMTRVYDIEKAKKKRTILGNDGINSVGFSPDGKVIAVGIADAIIKIYDTKNWQELKSLNGHTGSILSTAFSPDGLLLATASNDRTIKLFDAKTWECVRTLQNHTDGVKSVSFSKDGKYLVSSGMDGRVVIWNLK